MCEKEITTDKTINTKLLTVATHDTVGFARKSNPRC